MDPFENFTDSSECKGPSQIRSLVANTDEPGTYIKKIKAFQHDNSLKIGSPSLDKALNLLDLLDIPRLKFYEQAAACLSKQLSDRIRDIGSRSSMTPHHVEGLEQLLKKCFPLYKVPLFRPVVLDALANLPEIPEEYQREIVCNEDLYKDCAISVRRQIWRQNRDLFFQSIKGPIDNYIEKKVMLLRDVEFSKRNFFTAETTRARRQWEEITELLKFVGEHCDLYESLLMYIREEFIRTANTLYCSLRAELVMAAHELNLALITRSDQCHAFAWCLDACVRDRHLDSVQNQKIKGIMDSVQQENIKMIGDMAMIAADPHVTHFMMSSIIKKMRDFSGENYLPRDLPSVHLAIRIVTFGSKAHEIMSKGLPEEIVDWFLLTKFLPSLGMIMLEDTMRLELAKHGVDILAKFNIAEYRPISELVKSCVKVDKVAALLYFHYLLDILPRSGRIPDQRTLCRGFELLGILKDQPMLQPIWGHLFIFGILHSYEATRTAILSVPALWQVVVDDLILKKLVENDTAAYLLMRLIVVLSDRWDPSFALTLLQSLNSLTIMDNPIMLDSYNKVHTKIEARIAKINSTTFAVAAGPLLDEQLPS